MKDHGKRKQMGLDVPVYVDRVQRAALRRGDMPQLPEGRAWNGARGFRLYDYLTALGVNAARVKSVHLQSNGGRVGTITGRELVAHKNDLVFAFSDGDTGAPLARWSSSSLADTFGVHEIRRLSVFVDDAPPVIDRALQCALDQDGHCDDRPYEPEQGAAKGTRIYMDGRMVASVKKKTLGDALIARRSEDGRLHFSLTRYLAQVGVDASRVRAVEALAGDDVVARAESSWQAVAPKLTFTTADHAHGKVRLAVPRELQADAESASDREALVTAILLYRDTPVPKRALSAISEDTDRSVLLASANALTTD